VYDEARRPRSVPAWCWAIRDSRKLTTKARLVALTLALRMDWETLQCWPSVALLQAETALGRRTVQRALDELRSSGYLWMWRQRGFARGESGRTNMYRAYLPAWWGASQ
jgi:hypothetical protein